MDHIDEYLATACRNVKISKAIRAALSIGKQTLNRYYNKTDHSDVYRIAMGLFFWLFLYISFESLLQFYILVISYNTLRKPVGRVAGFKHLARLSVRTVPNLIKLMHSWMSKNTRTPLPLLPLLPYVFFSSLYLILTYPTAFIFCWQHF
jgi:hypothetical protein